MAVVESTFRVMASHAHVIVVDGASDSAAFAQRALEQLESAWSRFLPSSEISRLNLAGGTPTVVSAETFQLVHTMVDAWRRTNGRFDPTLLPALLAAGYVASIDDPSATTPVADLAPTGPLPAAGLDEVHLESATRTVTLPASVMLDPGGLGKGLAADLIVAELLARGAQGALVSIGGDLAAAGEAPDATGWTIEVEDPLDARRILARLALSGGGVATSSTQSRRWVHAGSEQHHVLEPCSGTPSTSDLAGVTVIASCGWHAEAHATALLLGGTSEFVHHTQTHGIEALATTNGGAVLATAALDGLYADNPPLEVAR